MKCEYLENLISNIDIRLIGERGLKRPKLPQSLPLIGAGQAWAKGFTGSGFTIAILDAGVDSNHPFIAGKVDAEACFSTMLRAPIQFLGRGLRFRYAPTD